jgi:hypothetical protein
LTLASAFFKAQFSSNWREGRELGENGTVAVHISTADHDSWTMSILMNMIHGRQRHIPFSVTKERLWKVALATNYFLCHEVMQSWGLWCSRRVLPTLPGEFTSSTWEWIFISYVFGWDSLFQYFTILAQQKVIGSGYSGPSAIPKWIVDEIFNGRNEYLKRCFNLVNQQIDYLTAKKSHCTFDCDAKKAGALMKYLSQSNLVQRVNLGTQQVSPMFACSPFSFSQATKKWKNPEHDSQNLNNRPSPVENSTNPRRNTSSSSKTPPHTSSSPRYPLNRSSQAASTTPCAHKSLLGEELTQHIEAMAEQLKGISKIPARASEPR